MLKFDFGFVICSLTLLTSVQPDEGDCDCVKGQRKLQSGTYVTTCINVCLVCHGCFVTYLLFELLGWFYIDIQQKHTLPVVKRIDFLSCFQCL